jgi:uncharacterized protein (TIGR03435 family)
MQRTNEISRSNRRNLLRAAGLLAATLTIAFGLASATPGRAQAQSQGQSTAATVPTYEYEVVSIKVNKSTGAFPNFSAGEDGFTLQNLPLFALVASAFGVLPDRISGMPDWLNSEKYDVSTKMDPSVSEALKKMSADDKKTAQQLMIQALLADRCKLKFHRETKELPVYTLTIAKNGPKFQESKPDDKATSAAEPTATNSSTAAAAVTSAGGMKVPDGRGGFGSIKVGAGGAVTFHALPLTMLTQILSVQLGRQIVDKTGLTGKYDFTWQFTPDPSQNRAGGGGAPGDSQPPAGGGGVPVPADPTGTSLFTAVQEQLGLRLESGKGPVEIFVIDHIERPSDN